MKKPDVPKPNSDRHGEWSIVESNHPLSARTAADRASLLHLMGSLHSASAAVGMTNRYWTLDDPFSLLTIHY